MGKRKDHGQSSAGDHSYSVGGADSATPHASCRDLYASHPTENQHNFSRSGRSDESSSSASASESDIQRALALIPQPPFSGFPPGMFGMASQFGLNPYAMAPPGFGPFCNPSMMMGQMMSGFNPAAMGGFNPAAMGGFNPAAMGGAPLNPLQFKDQDIDDILRMSKNPIALEHASLRQFVIFMAIMFLLAFVALIVTAVYFGHTLSSTWNH